jgi:septation ring formation regulator EzrA
MDKNTEDILDALDFIKERMATKSDVAELRLELHTFRTEAEANFRLLRRELTDINKRLDMIEQNYANLKGVTKEIDEIRAEVRAIQKHLGIERKIAA